MKRLIVIAVAVFAFIMVLATIAPKQIDWRETYSKADNIPFGGKILFTVLNQIYPQQQIDVSTTTLFETISKQNYVNGRTNLIIINSGFEVEKQSVESLLEFVAEGNTAFISASWFNNQLKDTLRISTQQTYLFSDKDTLRYRLLGEATLKYDTLYRKYMGVTHISAFDTTTTSILGQFDDGKVNFVRVRFGDGDIYLHTIPAAFSNYVLMKPNHRRYAWTSLSYLPSQQTIWDEYYKDVPKAEKSSFSVMLQDWRLTATYYVILFGLTIFILINGKRRQRIIPIIPPLKNATLDYVQKVGLLYYQHRDSKTIIEKKILYFNEYLRTRYYLREVKYNEELYEKIAAKTAVPLDSVRTTFQRLTTIAERIVNDDEDVLAINKIIEEFKQQITI